MPELLFEIYSEEIPSEVQKYGSERFYALLQKRLHLLFGLKFTGEYFFTPRRISGYINDIPATIEEKTQEIRGPKMNAPENAVLGFLKKYGVVDISQLTKKEGYYYYTEKLERQHSNQLLQVLLEEIISSFQWPKSMKWGAHRIKWVRPIHSMLCVYNGKVIPFKYGHMTASDTTVGNWMLSNKKIKVSSFNEYKNKLQNASVCIVQHQRILSIYQQVKKICTQLKLSLIEDEGLTKEVANLVEQPNVAIGKIDTKFMKLPKEVLITTLKYHQKYLMLENADKTLAPYFIIVSNVMTEDNLKTVIAGNERVLNARLADAEFFYNQDVSTKLVDKFQKLKKVTFHHEIGSYYDKMQIVLNVALDLSEQLKFDAKTVERTAYLLKADLVTEMVKELPELQGVIGYYYALKDGEDQKVADAVKDHYLPQGPTDHVPTAHLSIIMALADKIVTLNSLFEINIKPTGSKDPFALRRAAIGIVRIICSNHLNLKLKNLLRQDVVDFILDRVEIIEVDKSDTYSINLRYIKEAL
jgi:glycyl-tRNA synthetase beta chain